MKAQIQIVLKELRKQLGKTQEEVAKDLNITQSTYSNYENGLRQPNIEMLIDLADYYKVPIDILVGRYQLRTEKE